MRHKGLAQHHTSSLQNSPARTKKRELENEFATSYRKQTAIDDGGSIVFDIEAISAAEALAASLEATGLDLRGNSFYSMNDKTILAADRYNIESPPTEESWNEMWGPSSPRGALSDSVSPKSATIASHSSSRVSESGSPRSVIRQSRSPSQSSNRVSEPGSPRRAIRPSRSRPAVLAALTSSFVDDSVGSNDSEISDSLESYFSDVSDDNDERKYGSIVGYGCFNFGLPESDSESSSQPSAPTGISQMPKPSPNRVVWASDELIALPTEEKERLAPLRSNSVQSKKNSVATKSKERNMSRRLSNRPIATRQDDNQFRSNGIMPRDEPIDQNNESSQHRRRRVDGNCLSLDQESEGTRSEFRDQQQVARLRSKSDDQPIERIRSTSRGQDIVRSRSKSRDHAIEQIRNKSKDRPIKRTRSKSRYQPIECTRSKSRDRTVERTRCKSRDQPIERTRGKSRDRPIERARNKSSGQSIGRTRSKSGDRPMERTRSKLQDTPIEQTRRIPRDQEIARTRFKSRDQPFIRSRSKSGDEQIQKSQRKLFAHPIEKIGSSDLSNHRRTSDLAMKPSEEWQMIDNQMVRITVNNPVSNQAVPSPTVKKRMERAVSSDMKARNRWFAILSRAPEVAQVADKAEIVVSEESQNSPVINTSMTNLVIDRHASTAPDDEDVKDEPPKIEPSSVESPWASANSAISTISAAFASVIYGYAVTGTDETIEKDAPLLDQFSVPGNIGASANGSIQSAARNISSIAMPEKGDAIDQSEFGNPSIRSPMSLASTSEALTLMPTQTSQQSCQLDSKNRWKLNLRRKRELSAPTGTSTAIEKVAANGPTPPEKNIGRFIDPTASLAAEKKATPVEELRKEEEAKKATAAENLLKEEEAKKAAAAEKLRTEEEAAKKAAVNEKFRREEEAKKVATAEKLRTEEDATTKAAADEKFCKEEEAKKVAAVEKLRTEEEAKKEAAENIRKEGELKKAVADDATKIEAAKKLCAQESAKKVTTDKSRQLGASKNVDATEISTVALGVIAIAKKEAEKIALAEVATKAAEAAEKAAKTSKKSCLDEAAKRPFALRAANKVADFAEKRRLRNEEKKALVVEAAERRHQQAEAKKAKMAVDVAEKRRQQAEVKKAKAAAADKKRNYVNVKKANAATKDEMRRMLEEAKKSAENTKEVAPAEAPKEKIGKIVVAEVAKKTAEPAEERRLQVEGTGKAAGKTRLGEVAKNASTPQVVKKIAEITDSCSLKKGIQKYGTADAAEKYLQEEARKTKSEVKQCRMYPEVKKATANEAEEKRCLKDEEKHANAGVEEGTHRPQLKVTKASIVEATETRRQLVENTKENVGDAPFEILEMCPCHKEGTKTSAFFEAVDKVCVKKDPKIATAVSEVAEKAVVPEELVQSRLDDQARETGTITNRERKQIAHVESGEKMHCQTESEKASSKGVETIISVPLVTTAICGNEVTSRAGSVEMDSGNNFKHTNTSAAVTLQTKSGNAGATMGEDDLAYNTALNTDEVAGLNSRNNVEQTPPPFCGLYTLSQSIFSLFFSRWYKMLARDTDQLMPPPNSSNREEQSKLQRDSLFDPAVDTASFDYEECIEVPSWEHDAVTQSRRDGRTADKQLSKSLTSQKKKRRNLFISILKATTRTKRDREQYTSQSSEDSRRLVPPASEPTYLEQTQQGARPAGNDSSIVVEECNEFGTELIILEKENMSETVDAKTDFSNLEECAQTSPSKEKEWSLLNGRQNCPCGLFLWLEPNNSNSEKHNIAETGCETQTDACDEIQPVDEGQKSCSFIPLSLCVDSAGSSTEHRTHDGLVDHLRTSQASVISGFTTINSQENLMLSSLRRMIRFIDENALGLARSATPDRCNGMEVLLDLSKLSKGDGDSVDDLTLDEITFDGIEDAFRVMKQGDGCDNATLGDNTLNEIKQALRILKEHSSRMGISEIELVDAIMESEKMGGEFVNRKRGTQKNDV